MIQTAWEDSATKAVSPFASRFASNFSQAEIPDTFAVTVGLVWTGNMWLLHDRPVLPECPSSGAIVQRWLLPRLRTSPSGTPTHRLHPSRLLALLLGECSHLIRCWKRSQPHCM